jgi:hypothetical protein
MKIGGVEIARYEGVYQLMRDDGKGGLVPHDVGIRALPYSWELELTQQLPKPVPESTGKLVKDPATGKMVEEKDDASPEHLHRLAKWHRLVQAKRIYDGSNPASVEWSADPETLTVNPAKFYGAIADELDAVLGSGEVMHWSNCIVGISQVGGYDIALSEERMFRYRPGTEKLPPGEQPEEEPMDGDVHDALPRSPDLPGVAQVAE